MIIITASANLSQDGQPPSENAVEASINQCISDAVEGSFDEPPRHMQPMLRLRGKRISDDSREFRTHREVRFTFGLPAEMFPVDSGGLQLLVNILAGDMFPTEVLGCRWSNVCVHSVELPPDLRERAVSTFRKSAHTIGTIRAAFRLPARRPLLAFSLKPRVGLSFSETRGITLGVLEAGFNIVEHDSRNLALRSAPISDWIRLGIEAAQVGSHVTAFAPNLSIPAPQLLDKASAWVEAISPYGPPVIKVDGGLDGLSSLQAIRLALDEGSSPIVTCYPILRNQLTSAIGDSTWVDFLSLSGADIIYPGGRPTFPGERRPVWGAHADGWSRAARIYDSMIARQWPMPTIAGGIHPGHLHACYELLGPQVAYFLGGAVALHPESPARGARLCVEILDNAISLAARAESSGADYAEDLPPRLLRKVERTRYPKKTLLDYVSPATIFGASAPARPTTFYRRD